MSESENKKEHSRQYKIDVTLKVFLEMVQGTALQVSPIKDGGEIKEGESDERQDLHSTGTE